jgi:hypothetical protein
VVGECRKGQQGHPPEKFEMHRVLPERRGTRGGEEMTEDAANNLVDEKGNIIVPVEKRQRCLVYSRPCGYLSPVENWNPGKQAEWVHRSLVDKNTLLGGIHAEKRP